MVLCPVPIIASVIPRAATMGWHARLMYNIKKNNIVAKCELQTAVFNQSQVNILTLNVMKRFKHKVKNSLEDVDWQCLEMLLRIVSFVAALPVFVE
jgi:hypothetical protein